MQLNFSCPECGNDTLEEIIFNGVGACPIQSIDETGHIVYGDTELEDYSTERFQCSECGFHIPDVEDVSDLVEYLQGPVSKITQVLDKLEYGLGTDNILEKDNILKSVMDELNQIREQLKDI